jgi:AmmeMemoRadiSam system protein B
VKALKQVETPLGRLNIIKNDFEDLNSEHSVENQIPFLQKLNPDVKVLPLVIGEITNQEAKKIAEKISKIPTEIYIFSTDLSHFLSYEQAIEIDKKTIDIIQNLNLKKWEEIDACGKFPLLVMIHLCKLKNYFPKLIEYKNSGDITGDKNSVVGYASFWF